MIEPHGIKIKETWKRIEHAFMGHYAGKNCVEIVEHGGQNEEGGPVEKLVIHVYTATNRYRITAIDKKGLGYLGCIATARKPRAGEDWHRGSDLPDGELYGGTFDKIIEAIAAYELVKVHFRAGEQRIKESKMDDVGLCTASETKARTPMDESCDSLPRECCKIGGTD